jgi:GNAT superfamily N-acetyltransferase
MGKGELHSELDFFPLTPERWEDLELLFGEHGAYGGCWCMWWRLTRRQFEKQLGEENRLALKAIVDSGEVPGILAYAGSYPVAWCSVGPRNSFPALERSRNLRRVDDLAVWSIVCFYVDKRWRGRGIMLPLLKATISYAREQGAEVVEGYPIEPGKRLSGSSGYTGIVSTYRRAGFVEVLRRKEHQPIMRYFIAGGKSAAAEGERTRW